MFSSSVAEKNGVKWVNMTGRIDSLSSPDIQKQFNELVLGGDRILIANFEEINYMSSAGLRIFLTVQKQLNKAGGEIILFKPSEMIFDILKLSCFDQVFRIAATEDELQTLLQQGETASACETYEQDGILIQYLTKEVGKGKLVGIGTQKKLAQSGYEENDVIMVNAQDIQFGTGLAALGDQFNEYKHFFGESLIANHHLYFYPAVKRPAVDFMICPPGNASLQYKFLHGFGFSGSFQTLLKFEKTDGFIELSKLIEILFQLTDSNLIGIAMLAESKGFLGMHLKQVPIIENQPENGKEIFESENFSSWVNFPVEPGEINHIIIGVGIAIRSKDNMDSHVNELMGAGNFHLHAGIFEREPLSKNIEHFEEELNRVLTQLEIYKVQHMMGQSRFNSGMIGLIDLSV